MHNQMIVDMRRLYDAANDVAGSCWTVGVMPDNARIEDRDTGRRVWVVEHGSYIVVVFTWNLGNKIRSEGWRGPAPIKLYIPGSKILLAEPQGMMVTLRDLMQEASPKLRWAELGLKEYEQYKQAQ